jgi:hypothetical protein
LEGGRARGCAYAPMEDDVRTIALTACLIAVLPISAHACTSAQLQSLKNQADEARKLVDVEVAASPMATPKYNAAEAQWVALDKAMRDCEESIPEGWWMIGQYSQTCENKGSPAKGYADAQSLVALSGTVGVPLSQKNLKLVDKSSLLTWIKGESEAAEIVYTDPDGHPEILGRYFRTQDACEAALQADMQAEQDAAKAKARALDKFR